MSEKSKSFSPLLVKKIVKLVKETSPDIIQCNGSDTLKYMVTASFFLPKTPIVYRNISMISNWLRGVPHKFLYQYFFKRIDHVSSVGKQAVEDFIKTCKYPREKTSVIRRGIPMREINREVSKQKLLSSLDLSEGDKIIMHIGNFSPEKNHIFLIDVFTKIASTHQNIKLVCVGDGILFEEIKEEISRRGLNNTIFLLGFRKDILEMLSAADCFVLPSLVEGVPGVVLEAAVQKVPTVATNVGGVKEVLKNGVTGYIINDFNKDFFTEKLITLANHSQLRKELGQNAYDLAIEEYNPEKNARDFETLYLRLIRQKSVT
ncbi:glycosyltransferase family 4 protein [Antarcticibacterium sp. 1MA-6-2]|uniref:glycosyltransferase family 4 protein n=1 Tax=Antarcticibacterium sp. 1MA-6-2 TaxID=2908210 RepID=UPI001F2C146E|nr:glycosyltransferase family 4 protein [Antarcticibacterium sp. 1MA-6-2]UJH91312.1 glycosyltransferase family 4 protein [Antarcticibacterium sp. 1MA-6-2]